MQPTLFFPFIHSYGLMLAIGFYAGWYLAARRARAAGVDPDLIGNLVLVSILAGVVGARILYFVLEKRADESLWGIIKVWEGGLVFYGGLIGAFVADALYVRWKGLSAWRIGDVLAPAIAIGQAFGRIGCFFNGCCFGGPATASFPLSARFPRFLGEAAEGTAPEVLGSPVFRQHFDLHWIGWTAEWSLPVHATQLYDSVGLFLIAALLVAATPHRKRQGELFGWLLLLHGALRLAVELVRRDTTAVALGLKAGQIGGIVALLLGAGILVWLRRHGKAPTVATT